MKEKAIFATVKRYLDKLNVKYISDPIPGGHAVYCPALSIPGRLKFVSQTIETKDTHLVTYAHCLIYTPSERIDEMAKFVALANYNMLLGNFDLDVDTGEVRHRLFLDCEGFRTLPLAILARYLPIPLLMLRQYGDAILSVAFDSVDAEPTLAQAQKTGVLKKT